MFAINRKFLKIVLDVCKFMKDFSRRKSQTGQNRVVSSVCLLTGDFKLRVGSLGLQAEFQAGVYREGGPNADFKT